MIANTPTPAERTATRNYFALARNSFEHVRIHQEAGRPLNAARCLADGHAFHEAARAFLRPIDVRPKRKP